MSRARTLPVLGRRWATMALVASVAALWAVQPIAAQESTAGQALYEKYCSQCHGDAGDGEGIATRFLDPRPRDFTTGKYKMRSTPTGSLPTDADIARAIRNGLPYTAMPPFPDLSDAEVDLLVEHLKTFSADFEDPEAMGDPIEIPTPPTYTEEAVARGEQVYQETGCARCHGELGRGDGMSAPTLVDDRGDRIRVADLTMPWTFRAGGTRTDIFRTMSTGFNGTPMPGFHGSLPVEDIWAITNYMVSLSGGPQEGDAVEAPYANVVRAVGFDGDLDLAQGRELFTDAPGALFPLFGQIVEPGRSYQSPIVAIEARAVYNEDEIAFLLSWNDMRAETSGTNGPDLPAPTWEQHLAETGQAGAADAAAGGDEGGFWGDEAADAADGGDFWGDEAVADDADGGDFWGDEVAEEPVADDAGDDFWGDETGGGNDDFWGEDDGGAAAAAPSGPDTEFSDAVALQLPAAPGTGIRKPYFIFGDTQNAVDLWFVDLADPKAKRYVGRGSNTIVPADGGDPVEVVSDYDQGRWSVVLKRKRRARGSIGFAEGTFVPVAFSVWDGFSRERGNRRALTSWYNLYLEPLEEPAWKKPVLGAFFGILFAELLLIGLVRFLRRRQPQS